MKSLESRIRIGFPIIFGFLLITTTFFLHFYIKEVILQYAIHNLSQQANMISNIVAHHRAVDPLVDKEKNVIEKPITAKIEDLFKYFALRDQLLVIDFNGAIIYSSEKSLYSVNNNFKKLNKSLLLDKLLYEKDFKEASLISSGFDIRFWQVTHAEYLYCTKKFKNYYVRIATPYENINASINYIDAILLVFMGIILFTAIVISYYIYARIIKPIKQVTRHSKKFKKNLQYRFPITRDDEIGELEISLTRVANATKRQMDEIIFRKEEAEAVIKNVSEGVLILNNKLKILLHNDGLLSLLNIDPSVYHHKLKDKYYYEVVRNNSLNKLIEESYQHNKRLVNNLQLSRIDDIVIEVTCIPLPNKAGVVVLINNITEQYRLMQVKKSFVENVSHEFKTPLAIIKGYIETLIKSKNCSYKDRSRFLVKILRNTDRLNNLIQDLITLNKLDESKNYFKKEKINAVNVVDSCFDILSIKAETKGIELVNNIQEEKIYISGNSELLEIIFFNLIDNGIIYTEPGGVIEASFERHKGQGFFSIIDTGIGIQGDYRDRIFERFYRVDESRSRKSGGTGLGLSIVKHAVIFHNGKVLCVPNPTGRGTEFKIIIPLLKIQHPPLTHNKEVK